jgi:hypothetical protein
MIFYVLFSTQFLFTIEAAMRLNLSALLVGLTFIGMSPSPAAQPLAFRCNSYVIDVGMHKMDVMTKCGKPGMADRRTERRRLGVRQHDLVGSHLVRTQIPTNRSAIEYEREIEIQVEEWVYNFGPQQFMQLLIFEDGRLKQIQDLGYGK